MAQIGDAEDEDKNLLMNEQNIGTITWRGIKLILVTKNLGEYKEAEVEVSNGRYGPYIRHGAAFISLPKGETHWMLILIVQKNLLMKSTCWCTNSSL
jgi:DNA topoisomerase-1